MSVRIERFSVGGNRLGFYFFDGEGQFITLQRGKARLRTQASDQQGRWRKSGPSALDNHSGCLGLC
jgi:hypothetical protein